MPKVTDLTGRVLSAPSASGGLDQLLAVVGPGPTVNRVRSWEIAYPFCEHSQVLPHAMLMLAFDGKGGVPECATCHPGAPGINRGMHSGPGDPPHQVGTPCRVNDVSAPAGWAMPAFPGDEPAADLEDLGSELGYPIAELAAQYVADEHAQVAELAACGERLETYGKAEGLEDAQGIYGVVVGAATQEPRPPSRQLPGMSHLGTPCDRKLAARMLEGSDNRGPAWRPFVGIAGHEALSRHLEMLTGPESDSEHDRWLPDLEVEAGGSKGMIDVLDADTNTLIDFKFTGVTKLRDVARGKVLPVYQGQLDLYALGLTLAGHLVESVAVLALPLAGEVEDAAWYSRPANLGHASTLVARGWRIRGEAMNGRPLSAFAIAEDSCDYCPLKRRGDCQGVGRAAQPPKVAVTWGGPAVANPPGV